MSRLAPAGHLRIGEGARIGAQAGVISDVLAGAVLLGSPNAASNGVLPPVGGTETHGQEAEMKRRVTLALGGRPSGYLAASALTPPRAENVHP
jgi:hypothetical protein